MQLSELIELLESSRESSSLEFKEAKNSFDKKKLLEYCVGISNSGGGKLILGVTDRVPRKVVGTNALRDLETQVVQPVYEKLGIKVSSYELPHPDGRVVVIDIPARAKGRPLQIDGRYLTRAGSSLCAMTPDELMSIFNEGESSFIEDSCVDLVLPEKVREILDTDSFFSLQDLSYPFDLDEVLEALLQHRLIAQSGSMIEITNLGAVVLGKDLSGIPELEAIPPRVIAY